VRPSTQEDQGPCDGRAKEPLAAAFNKFWRQAAWRLGVGRYRISFGTALAFSRLRRLAAKTLAVTVYRRLGLGDGMEQFPEFYY